MQILGCVSVVGSSPAGTAEHNAIQEPQISLAHGGRQIAQKKLDGYVLRVVYEKQSHKKVVVTVYKARRERYEI